MQILNVSKLKSKRHIVLIATMLLLSFNASSIYLQSNPARNFPETRHNVRGAFLKFFDDHGGLRIFGYPITEEFTYNGFIVQYFQNARMELHPENPPAYLVQLGLLGDELGHGKPPLPPTGSDLYHRYFPETGHTVAFIFLNFYDNNGGLDIFGYPIAEFSFENGHYVQYFQRAKMEWHPELSGSNRDSMQLADLGSIHFDVAHLSPALKDPVPALGPNGTPSASSGPTAIKVSASVSSAVTGRSGQQRLFVFVTDPDGNPIPNANAFFAVWSPGTSASLKPMGQTDSKGFVSADFEVDGSHVGERLIIEVKATLNTLSNATQITYMPWY